MEFNPEQDEQKVEIPYFEDASSTLGVKGHATKKSEAQLQAEIERIMARLDAMVTSFTLGRLGPPPEFGRDNRRWAWRIEFHYHGAPGRVTVAALPLKKPTPAKIRDAKRQALYSFLDRMEATFNSRFSVPGDMPFGLNLLDKSGKTMLEWLQEQDRVPKLEAPHDPTQDEGEDGDAVEGEFTEV